MNRSSFDEFLTVVTNRVWEYLPECFSDARFELSTVAKNNGFVLTGLVIRSNTSNTSPVIYLDQYYEAYMDGRDIDDILREIAQVRLETEVKDSFGAENIMDFDFVKDKIVPRLSSIEWNTGLLEVRPHTQIADLAVTYYVMLAQDETGVASIPVTFKLMETWGVEVDTLHDLALQNPTRLFPTTFVSMSSMLRGLLPSIEDDDSSDGLYGECAVDEMLAKGKEIHLHTIAGWRTRGNYRVIKGEHGYECRLWKKRKVKSVEGDPYEEFYKTKAYLFTETQVELVNEPDIANEVQN